MLQIWHRKYGPQAKKMDTLDVKGKSLNASKDTMRKWKDKQQGKRKYLQNTYHIENLHPGCAKNLDETINPIKSG